MAVEAQLIGGNIRVLRKARDLTQRELAAKLPGKTEGKDISRYETGRHRPGPDTLAAIADALGVSVGDLYATPNTNGPVPDPFAKGGELPYKVVDVERAIRMEAKLDALLKHFGLEYLTPEAATRPKKGKKRT